MLKANSISVNIFSDGFKNYSCHFDYKFIQAFFHKSVYSNPLRELILYWNTTVCSLNQKTDRQYGKKPGCRWISGAVRGSFDSQLVSYVFLNGRRWFFVTLFYSLYARRRVVRISAVTRFRIIAFPQKQLFHILPYVPRSRL